jgi:hypothetical protein
VAGKLREFRCEIDKSKIGTMRESNKGPAMTLGNMRALGITSIDVTCACKREAIVDASGWPDAIEIPELCWRLKCSECGDRPVDVRPDWTQYRASGNGRL